MYECKKIPETMIVDCSNWGAGPFSVLIVPMPDQYNENMRQFYLIHKRYGIVYNMFGLVPDNDEHAAELAYYNAKDYIPNFIKECLENE
jgi:hypothetical protein